LHTLHYFPTRRSSDLCKILSLSVAVDPLCQPEVGGTAHKNAAMTRMVITGRLIKTYETSIAIQHVFFSRNRTGKGMKRLSCSHRSEEHTSELQSRGHL